MEPESLFKVWSADEVAECLPGVSKEDYSMLWGVVSTATLPPLGETPDTCFERSLSKVWDKIPDDAKARLNALAREFEKLGSKEVLSMKTVKVYADPGHAWASVPVKELVDLGIAHKISSYSYRRTGSNTANLEEDCDLSLYIGALKAAGVPFKFKEFHTDKYSKIRSYRPFGISVIEKIRSKANEESHRKHMVAGRGVIDTGISK